jgi:large subunit ribosomal protein L4
MELQVNNADKIEVNDAAFACDFNEGLIHQVITSYMATGRQGSKAQKNRSDVRGGGAKPWRQKGTGRARAGTSRSPIWRSGGVTFAARPKSHEQKINKKMYRKAFASILSELVRKERLLAVESFSIAKPKTKEMLAGLKNLNVTEGSVLLVTLEQDNDLYLAARNLKHVDVFSVDQLDPVTLVAYDNIVMTVPCIRRLEEKLA